MTGSFRILIRTSVAGLYSDGQGGWTPNDWEAYDYKSALNAIHAAHQIGTDGLLLIKRFNDGRLDITHGIPSLSETLANPVVPKTLFIALSCAPFAVEASQLLKAARN